MEERSGSRRWDGAAWYSISGDLVPWSYANGDASQICVWYKSSNKWSCAVCNQKQSVLRVFAQGFMAKDIRKFVQTFNMSRKSLDDGECLLARTLDQSPKEGEGEPEIAIIANSTEKKKTDWTAYLDHDDHQMIQAEQELQHGDGDFEPQVVTELHQGMLK